MHINIFSAYFLLAWKKYYKALYTIWFLYFVALNLGVISSVYLIQTLHKYHCLFLDTLMMSTHLCLWTPNGNTKLEFKIVNITYLVEKYNGFNKWIKKIYVKKQILWMKHTYNVKIFIRSSKTLRSNIINNWNRFQLCNCIH